MLNGTVILAHSDAALTAGVENMLCMNFPPVHVERTQTGREALVMQSIMRADAVFMESTLKDMPGAHLVSELRRDIARPFIIVSSRERSAEAERRAARMGADGYVPAPIDLVRLCDLIGAQLRVRSSAALNGSLPEMMLQRVFSDNGLTSELQGYGYMKHALSLLYSGRANLSSMRDLYEQIGERFGRTADSVERNIRYAIGLCVERTHPDGARMSNRQFIAGLMEECMSDKPGILKPRVSVVCSGRRVFR